MPATSTPPAKSTRSNSASSSAITINDIKRLLADQKSEIISKLTNEITKIAESVHVLSEKVKEIECILKGTNEKIAMHDRVIKTLHDEMDNIASNLSNQILHEAEDRTNRMYNVILSGVAENPHGSVTDRQKHDRDEVSNVLLETETQFSEHDIVSCQRIGRFAGGRPRLLRVVLSNRQLKNVILRNARSLRRSENYKQVYINPDRTKIQLLEQKKLRDELLRLRNDGEDVVIYKNTIKYRSELNPRNFQ